MKDSSPIILITLDSKIAPVATPVLPLIPRDQQKHSWLLEIQSQSKSSSLYGPAKTNFAREHLTQLDFPNAFLSMTQTL